MFFNPRFRFPSAPEVGRAELEALFGHHGGRVENLDE